MIYRKMILSVCVLALVSQAVGLFGFKTLSREELMGMTKEEIIDHYENKLIKIKKVGSQSFERNDVLIEDYKKLLIKSQSFVKQVSKLLKINLKLLNDKIASEKETLSIEKNREEIAKKLVGKQNLLVISIEKHISTLNSLIQSKASEIKRLNDVIQTKNDLVAEKELLVKEKQLRIKDLEKGLYRPLFQMYIQGGANYYRNVYNWTSDSGLGANGNAGFQLNFDYLVKGLSVHLEGGYDIGNLNGKTFIKYKFF